ncbi:hypothetical protein [Nocardiopsis rhodophaea]|uniref:hypothetical protein n=1 Tax=Nocardiopsis rhodophaea TaxID=280238 RepID=UPI0031E15C52
MSKKAAARIQAPAARDTRSSTSETGFKQPAQPTADRRASHPQTRADRTSSAGSG